MAKKTWTPSSMGKKGGKKGGKARQRQLTTAQRRALGRKGAKARWKKKRPQKHP